MTAAQKTEVPVQPLKPTGVLVAAHAYTCFDAMVPCLLSQAALEDPALWVNAAFKFTAGDEVRVRAEDDSFVANLYVTFVQGTLVNLKMLNWVKLESVNYDLDQPEGMYEIKLRGPHKWCLVNKKTAEILQEGIPKQSQAVKALEDHLAALRR